MMSRMKKKLLPVAIAATLAGGFSANVNAIHVSKDGVGQLLMSPLYLSKFGYDSKISIVNTREDVAVRTRVALRSRVSSIEFDFMCYMTPADVCKFEIVKGDDGQAYLSSTDDSLLANKPSTSPDYRPIFASQCAFPEGQEAEFCKDGKLWVKIYDDLLPINTGGKVYQPDYPDPVTSNDDRALLGREAHPDNPDENEIGHIEVVGTWAVKGIVTYRDGGSTLLPSGIMDHPSVTIKRGMPKPELYKLFGPLVPNEVGGAGEHQDRGRLAGYPVPLGQPYSTQDESRAVAQGRLIKVVDDQGRVIDFCSAVPVIADASNLNGASTSINTEFRTNSVVEPQATDVSYQGAPCYGDGSARTDNNGSNIRSTDPTWIKLFATQEMKHVSGDRIGLQMTALDGSIWDNVTPVTHNPPYGMYSYSPTAGLGPVENRTRGVLSYTYDYGILTPGGAPITETVFESYAFDGRVISNPSFDIQTGAPLDIGFGFGQVRAGFGLVPVIYDNIVEIENALANSNFMSTYEQVSDKSQTNFIVTFPTKYRHLTKEAIPDKDNNRVVVNQAFSNVNQKDRLDLGDVCASGNVVIQGQTNPEPGTSNYNGEPDLLDGRYYYPPFNPDPSGSVIFSVGAWNNQEGVVATGPGFLDPFSGRAPGGPGSRKTITAEVSYVFASWPFESGWFKLNLNAEPGCQYRGVPALAYTHKADIGADGFENSWLVPMSSNLK